MNLSGVILTGGENRRFGGRSKTDILINGKTILSGIIETISEIFDEIIIVTKATQKSSYPGKLITVKDIFLNAGPLGGLHAGMKASSKEAVFVFAGDMPSLDKQVIISQIELFNSNNCDALIPLIDDKPEPLHSIYAVSVLPSLEKFLKEHGDYAMTTFISLIKPYYLKVERGSPEARSFMNINSPSDLDSMRKLL